MYRVYVDGNYIGKMNGTALETWLLKERSPVQTELIFQNLNYQGRHNGKGIVIKRFIK